MDVIAPGWTHELGMKSDKVTREAAVAYARKELTAILAHVAEIEDELPTQDHELAKLLIRLEDLHAEEPPLFAESQEDPARYKFGRAMREGRAPSEYIPNVSPYVAQIEGLIAAAANSLVAHRALGIHAANFISENRVMLPQLRLFAAEVIRGHCPEPSGLGTPKVHPSRDALFYALLVDTVDRFGVTPTRNKASAAMSACDIVAEAMPKKTRLPKSYGALERIWLEGQREGRSPI